MAVEMSKRSNNKTLVLVLVLIVLFGLLFYTSQQKITGKTVEPEVGLSEKELFALKFSEGVREHNVSIRPSSRKVFQHSIHSSKNPGFVSPKIKLAERKQQTEELKELNKGVKGNAGRLSLKESREEIIGISSLEEDKKEKPERNRTAKEEKRPKAKKQEPGIRVTSLEAENKTKEKLSKLEKIKTLEEIRANKSIRNYHPSKEELISKNTIYIENGNITAISDTTISEEVVVRSGSILYLDNVTVTDTVRVRDHSMIITNNSNISLLYILEFSTLELYNSSISNDLNIFYNSYAYLDYLDGVDYVNIGDNSELNASYMLVRDELNIYENSKAYIAVVELDSDNYLYVDSLSYANINDITMESGDQYIEVYDKSKADIKNLEVNANNLYIQPQYYAELNIEDIEADLNNRFEVDGYSKSFLTINNADIESDYFEFDMYQWAESYLENFNVESTNDWDFGIYDNSNIIVNNSNFESTACCNTHDIDIYDNGNFTLIDSVLKSYYQIDIEVYYNGWFKVENSRIQSTGSGIDLEPEYNGFIDIIDSEIIADGEVYTEAKYGGFINIDNSFIYSENDDFTIYNEYGGWTDIKDSYIFADDDFYIEYLYEGGWLNITNTQIDAYYIYTDDYSIEYGGRADFNNVDFNIYDYIYFGSMYEGAWLNFKNCNITSYDGYFYFEDIYDGAWVNITNCNIDIYNEIDFDDVYEGGFIEIKDSNLKSRYSYFDYYGYYGSTLNLDNVDISAALDDVYIYFDEAYIGHSIWKDVNIDANEFELYLYYGSSVIAENLYVDVVDFVYLYLYDGAIFNVTNGRFKSTDPFYSDVELYLDEYGCFLNFDNVEVYSGDYLYIEVDSGSQISMKDSSVYAADSGELYAGYGAVFNAINTPINLEADNGLGSNGYFQAYNGAEVNIDTSLKVEYIDMGDGVTVDINDLTLTDGAIDLYYGAELYIDDLSYAGDPDNSYVYGYEGVVFEVNSGEIMLTNDDFELYDGAIVNLTKVDIIGEDGYGIDLGYGIRLYMDNVDIELENGDFDIYDGAYVDVRDSNIEVGDDTDERLEIGDGVEAYFLNTILNDELLYDGASKVIFEGGSTEGVEIKDAQNLTLKSTIITGDIKTEAGGWSPTAGTITLDSITLSGDVYAGGGPVLNIKNTSLDIKLNPSASSDVEKSIYRLSATNNATVNLDGATPFTVYNEEKDGSSNITKTGTIYGSTPIPAGVPGGEWIYFQPGNITTINTLTSYSKNVWLDNATLIIEDTNLTFTSGYDIILDNHSNLILINAIILSGDDIIARDSSTVDMTDSNHSMNTEAWYGSYINLENSEISNDVYIYQDSTIDMKNSEVGSLYIYDHSSSNTIEDSETDYLEVYGFSDAVHTRSNSSNVYVSGFSDFSALDGNIYSNYVSIDYGSSATLTNMKIDTSVRVGYYIPEPIILDNINFTSSSSNYISGYDDSKIIANNIFMNGSSNYFDIYSIAYLNATNLEIGRGNFDVDAYYMGEVNIENLNADLTSYFHWEVYEIGESSLKNAVINSTSYVDFNVYYMGSIDMENINSSSSSYWYITPEDYGFAKIKNVDFRAQSGTCGIWPDDFGIADIDDSDFYCKGQIDFYPEDGSFFYADNVSVILNSSSTLYIEPEFGSWQWINNGNFYSGNEIEFYPYYLGFLYIDDSNFESDNYIDIYPEYAAHMEIDDSNFTAKNSIDFDAYYGALGYMNNCNFYSNSSSIHLDVYDGADFDFTNCNFNASSSMYMYYYYGAIGNFKNNQLTSRNSYIYYYLDDGAMVETDNIDMDAYSYIGVYLYDGVYGDFKNVDMKTHGPNSYIDLYAYYFYVGDIENVSMDAQRYVYAEVEEGALADFKNIIMHANESYSNSYSELEYYSAYGDIENVDMKAEDVKIYLYDGYEGNIRNLTANATDNLDIDFYYGTIADIYNSSFIGSFGDIDIYKGVKLMIEDSEIFFRNYSNELYLYNGVDMELINTEVNINNDPAENGDIYMEYGSRLVSDSKITAEELDVEEGSYFQTPHLVLSDGWIYIYYGAEAHIGDLDELGILSDNYVDLCCGVTFNASDGELYINDSSKYLYGEYGFDIYLDNISIIGTNDSYVDLTRGGDVNLLNSDIQLGDSGSYFVSDYGTNTNIENSTIELADNLFKDDYGGISDYNNVDINEDISSSFGSDVLFDKSILRKNLNISAGSKVMLRDSTLTGSVFVPSAASITLVNSTTGGATISAGNGTTITLVDTTEEIMPESDGVILNAVNLYGSSTANLNGDFTVTNLNTHCEEASYLTTEGVTIVNTVIPITIIAQENKIKIHNAYVKIKNSTGNTVFNQKTDWEGRAIFIPPANDIYELTVTKELGGTTKTRTADFSGDCVDLTFRFQFLESLVEDIQEGFASEEETQPDGSTNITILEDDTEERVLNVNIPENETLDLSEVEIETTSTLVKITGMLIEKTVYFPDAPATLCVLDSADLASLSSEDTCLDAGEFQLACPGSAQDPNGGTVNCVMDGTTAAISPLEHSGIASTKALAPAPAAAAAPVPSGARGGCPPIWDCTEWTECSPEGIQTRDCVDTGPCKFADRTQEKRCEYIPPEEPEIVPEEPAEIPEERIPVVEEPAKVPEEKKGILGIIILVILSITVLGGIIGGYFYYRQQALLERQKILSEYIARLDVAIEDYLKKGWNKEGLRKAIIEKGWPEEIADKEIEKVFGRIGGFN